LVTPLEMRHKFSYVKAGIWYRPVIPVTLRCNKIEFNYLALLDSGADFNIFHGDIAQILKIDINKLKNPVKFAGIKQRAEGLGYFTSIDIGINNNLRILLLFFQERYPKMDMGF